MEIKPDRLDELKGKNPFKIPKGYIDGLTEQIMAAIPEVPHVETKVISMRDRVRPWLYLAAVFAGLLLFFKVFITPVSQDPLQLDNATSSLQAFILGDFLQDISDDDLDYLEFIENQYLDREFAEEIDNMD